MTNNQLQLIEHNSQRILTTAQIAEAYEVDTQTIHRNFHNNKDHYTEGKHYYHLEGDELKQFKDLHLQNLEVQNISMIRSLYIWTEKGALLHAKSLNTDQAWNAYEMLVDDYYRKIEQLAQVQPSQGLSVLEKETAQLKKQLKHLTERQNRLEKQVAAAPHPIQKTVYIEYPWGHRTIENKVLETLEKLPEGWYTAQQILDASDKVIQDYGIHRLRPVLVDLCSEKSLTRQGQGKTAQYRIG